MSDNDDIEVESDVSPGASSFPCGLSGGDSGWGSQQGDGGRGPGSRRLLPLPPPPGLGPPPSRSGLAPLRAPGLSGLLRLEVGRRHAASGTPALPPWRGVLRLHAPTLARSISGGQGQSAPGSHCPDPGEGTALRTCSIGPRSPPLWTCKSRRGGMREEE